MADREGPYPCPHCRGTGQVETPPTGDRYCPVCHRIKLADEARANDCCPGCKYDGWVPGRPGRGWRRLGDYDG